MSFVNLFIGGLLLPFRLYLKPYSFRAEITALAPDLRWDYNLWKARHHFREPEFRRGLLQIIIQSGIAFLWIPIAITSASLIQGQTFAELLSDQKFLNDLLTNTAIGVAIGVVGGVAFGVAFGFGVARGVVFGVAIGVAFGMASGVAFGVARGVLHGVAFGVASGVAVCLTVLHIPNLLLQWPISLTSTALSRLSQKSTRWLWPLCPIYWDEVILLPLPGLPTLLVNIYRFDPELGGQAIQETLAHRYQYRAAFRALAILAQQDAAAVASLPGLAKFADNRQWLDDETPLPEKLRAVLLSLNDASEEVAGALDSDSATNRLRRLEQAQEKLSRLKTTKTLEDFASAVHRWSELITAGIEAAQLQQRRDEPIPQVYYGDGRPVRPDQNPETQIPFKGRRSLFVQLENGLGGNENSRATFLLYGQRRSGKTSALLQLERRLGGSIIPVFLDCQSELLGGAGDCAGLLHGIARVVGDEARRRGYVLPDLTARELLNDPFPAFGRWLDALEKALGERYLLLCLDEFEALEKGIATDRFDERVLMTLRNIVQHRRRIHVLLSGSHHIDEQPPRWASALINTLCLSIGFLEEDDARDLIEHPVADFPDLYRAEAVDRILFWSRRQPYLIQLLCQLLVQRMNKAKRLPPASWVEVADVDAVVPVALESGVGYFSDLWRGESGGDVGQRLLEILAERKNETGTIDDLKRVEPDERKLREAMKLLLRRYIVERDGDGFRIVVPLVAEYIRKQRLI